MSKSYDHMFDSAFHGLALTDLLKSPVDALSGISAADGERLRAAFGIETVRDLGESPHFRRAAAMVEAATLHDDPGPPAGWSEFFRSAPVDHYLSHPAGRFRLDFGPVYYRGRLDGSARVLVIGQDPSTNEILAHRIFVGRSGQLVQRVLGKVGITRSYTMLNAFLFSVFGQFNSELEAISEEPEIEGYRDAFMDRVADQCRLQAVITFGGGARHAFERWPRGNDFPVFHAMHPAADEVNVIANWNSILPQLRSGVDPDDDGTVDPAPFGPAFGPEDLTPIPDFDLPFGVPDFHRRDGGHSSRDSDQKIIWQAP
jgi:hypothetical protein